MYIDFKKNLDNYGFSRYVTTVLIYFTVYACWDYDCAVNSSFLNKNMFKWNTKAKFSLSLSLRFSLADMP